MKRCVYEYILIHTPFRVKKMIKIDDIKKIMKLVLLTGDIKNIKPVSLLIVGKSGNGKTEVLSSFKKEKALYVTDLSAHGLVSELEKNPEINHIIVPDFIKLTQKNRSTSDNLISMLNAFIEEGGTKIRLKNFSVDLNDRKIGLITATTKASFSQNKKAWLSIGFVQRMLIISYDYSDTTIQEIFNFINNEMFIDEKKEKIKDIKSKEILTNKEINKKLNPFAKKSFRNLKNLQALVKANALLNNRKEATCEDVEEIIRLTKFMNLKFTKL